MKVDYKKLEKEYMTSNVSFRALAAKHKISTSTVTRYAKAHDWEEKRNARQQKATQKAIEDESVAQFDAWGEIKGKIFTALCNEWDKYNSGESKVKPGELVKATKDARDMGVFGITMSEKKLMAEVEKLQKELNATEADKTITIEIVGGDDFSN